LSHQVIRAKVIGFYTFPFTPSPFPQGTSWRAGFPASKKDFHPKNVDYFVLVRFAKLADILVTEEFLL
jgi:hypothetical protein